MTTFKTITDTGPPEEKEATYPPIVYATFVVYDIMERPELLDLLPDEHVGWTDCEDHTWEDLLNAPKMSHDTNWVRWMLEQGIAPGQEFTVRIEQPEHTQDYWGECDVIYGKAVVTSRETLSELKASLLWMGAWADSRPSALVSVSMENGLTSARQRPQPPGVSKPPWASK
jgi:hypothetical protein